ncbi:hypothetical protein MMC09_000410 [Bachmanniomyces sp. S44760]|nr:hypothetical protein [Bachmanniomyces sp. S44760]
MPGILRLATTLLAIIALRLDTLISAAPMKKRFVIAAAPTTTGTLRETSGVQPISCHLHNDYLRDIPLINALQFGWTSSKPTSSEKDNLPNDLYVSHVKVKAGLLENAGQLRRSADSAATSGHEHRAHYCRRGMPSRPGVVSGYLANKKERHNQHVLLINLKTNSW